MNRRNTFGALAATLCLAALSACGSSASVSGGTASPASSAVTSPAITATTGTNAATATTSPTSVPENLQFEATLVGGASFSGASRVGVPTAFWFWAPT